MHTLSATPIGGDGARDRSCISPYDLRVMAADAGACIAANIISLRLVGNRRWRSTLGTCGILAAIWWLTRTITGWGLAFGHLAFVTLTGLFVLRKLGRIEK